MTLLLRSAAVSSTLARAAVVAPMAATSVMQRGFRSSFSSRDIFKDKEHAEEDIYFRKEDQQALQKLAQKWAKKEASELEALKTLLAPNVLPEDVLQKLVDWKHHD